MFFHDFILFCKFIYINLSKNEVYLKNSEYFKIVNFLGEEVFKGNFNNSNLYTLETKEFNQGFYYCIIQTKFKTTIHKLLIINY
jgi:hypothetical protein